MSAAATGVVICSVCARDVARTAVALAAAPAACAFVEIRADHLRAAEVAGLVRSAGRAVIVTARRSTEGGEFTGSEDERRELLLAALDAGARYVDVELGLPLADLAEGEHADRVILSHHGGDCRTAALQAVVRRLAASRAARTKLVPAATSVDDALAVHEVLRSCGKELRLACFAMGRAGALTRLLTLAWGGWATYGSVSADSTTAPGQFTAQDLVDLYDVQGVTADTDLFALIGSHVFASPSPAMHSAGYREADIDARYIPIELADPEPFVRLLSSGVLPLRGFAVTMPFKGAIAARCATLDPTATRSRAVNTVVPSAGDWAGFNTDGPAALACLSRQGNPATRVAVLGAGGTARAIAASLVACGAEVTLYVRNEARGAVAGRQVGAGVEPWEAVRSADWEVLVNATPLGAAGELALPAAALTGRIVLDAVYGRARTPLVVAAQGRGLAVIDGFELLVEQAVLQFERFSGTRPRSDTLATAGRRWLGVARTGPIPLQ